MIFVWVGEVGDCFLVCVCVLSPRFTLGPYFSHAGGPSICCVRWSNEAATANADIKADHLDVPAQHRSINRAVLCCVLRRCFIQAPMARSVTRSQFFLAV